MHSAVYDWRTCIAKVSSVVCSQAFPTTYKLLLAVVLHRPAGWAGPVCRQGSCKGLDTDACCTPAPTFHQPGPHDGFGSDMDMGEDEAAALHPSCDELSQLRQRLGRTHLA